MSVFVTFTGDPATGEGPEATTLWGLTLPLGEAVETDDQKVIDMARRNPHFRVGETGERKAAPAPEPVQEDAGVHPEPRVEPEIPDNWRSLHHFTLMALARDLRPDLEESINSKEAAVDIIEQHLDGWGDADS